MKTRKNVLSGLRTGLLLTSFAVQQALTFNKSALLFLSFLVLQIIFVTPLHASLIPGSFHMITEGDPEKSSILTHRSYDSLTDLQDLNQASATSLGFDPFGTQASIGGLTYDGNQFHMVTEGDPDKSSILTLRSYDSLTDLLNLNQASATSLGFDPFGTQASIGGLAYDGNQFHMVTEGDPDKSNILTLRSYDSLLDLQNLNQSSATSLGSDPFGTQASIGGLTYDGNQFHLLVEGDPDKSSILTLRSYDSLLDLQNLNQSSATSLGFDPFGTQASTAGLTFFPPMLCLRPTLPFQASRGYSCRDLPRSG